MIRWHEVATRARSLKPANRIRCSQIVQPKNKMLFRKCFLSQRIALFGRFWSVRWFSSSLIFLFLAFDAIHSHQYKHHLPIRRQLERSISVDIHSKWFSFLFVFILVRRFYFFQFFISAQTVLFLLFSFFQHFILTAPFDAFFPNLWHETNVPTDDDKRFLQLKWSMDMRKHQFRCFRWKIENLINSNVELMTIKINWYFSSMKARD